MTKSIEQINEKIKSGKAVVLTAEEVSKLAQTESPKAIAQKVDVVTTATFGPMCSSGMFLNFGHSNPPIRMQNVTLNGVSAYAGIAAVDAYIGATQTRPDNPTYGGAHIIEDLIAGKDVHLKADSCGTDCYPAKYVEATINKNNVNEMIMFNPRNAYQNYPVATNTTNKTIHTYMGTLLPKLRNATYSTSGELSPLLNDPQMRTIGIGSKIFLCGTQGYVSWYGTQFHTTKPKNEFGVPVANSATLAVIGDAKEMNPDFVKAAYYEKYGVSIFIGIGIPIPVLDEEIAKFVSIRNDQITTTISDYGHSDHPAMGQTTYAELQSGSIEINGKKVRTAPMSSLFKARQIADILKGQISSGEFTLTAPIAPLPQNTALNGLKTSVLQ